MRRLLLVAAAVGFVALGVVSTPTPASAATHDAHATNTTFVDGAGCGPGGSTTTTIRAGDSVAWHNCDAFDHTVTADDMSFNRPLNAGGNVTIVFNNAGAPIPYHCEIHPSMQGTIHFQAQPTTTVVTQPTTTIKATTTTIKATTTAPSTSTSTTQTTLDLAGLDGSSTTSSSSTTSTTEPDATSDGGGINGLIVALLVLAIAGVGAGAYAVQRRMQAAA